MPESKRPDQASRKKAAPVTKPAREPDLDPELLCSEAQADGVPCTEVGRACEECERAVALKRKRS